MAAFSVEAMVRGYHVYESIWTAVVGEEFPCVREPGNTFDPLAVAVKREETIIGHVPRKISSTCALFLRRGGAITCQVTGPRRHSDDLVQGGLEVPCTLRFQGDAKVTTKAKKLVESALATTSSVDRPSKKRKVTSNCADEPDPKDSSGESEATKEWLQFNKGWVLTSSDKENILNEKKLDDRHITIAQNILKEQFPEMGGLRSPLFQTRKPPTESDDKIQIIHSRGDHWIVAASVFAAKGVVFVYDSVFRTIDRATKNIIAKLFPTSTMIKQVQINRQIGGKDCGVFAIAIATALAFNQNPALIKFDQPSMRAHLVACFEKGQLSPFPTV